VFFFCLEMGDFFFGFLILPLCHCHCHCHSASLPVCHCRSTSTLPLSLLHPLPLPLPHPLPLPVNIHTATQPHCHYSHCHFSHCHPATATATATATQPHFNTKSSISQSIVLQISSFKHQNDRNCHTQPLPLPPSHPPVPQVVADLAKPEPRLEHILHKGSSDQAHRGRQRGRADTVPFKRLLAHLRLRF
jgi:hypothetical protein